MELLKDRIRTLREMAGLSQADLGEAVGVSQQAVDKAEAGTTTKPSWLYEAASLFGIEYTALRDGPLPPLPSDFTEATRNRLKNQASPAMVNIHKRENHWTGSPDRPLPVYGARGGDGSGVIMLNKREPIDWVARPPELQNVAEAFAVVISGDSMEPRYHEGEIAWIHPGKPCLAKKGVLIEFEDGHALVKEFVNQTSDTLRVRQYNPAKVLTFRRGDFLRIYRIIGVADY